MNRRQPTLFSVAEDPPLFVCGEGPFLFTDAGDRYLDLVAGSAVTNLGHGLPAHRRAIERAMERGIYHSGNRLVHVERAELYGELAALLPATLPRIHFVSVGTEAVETAIKAAQYHTKRRRIFAFEGGYHGRTRRLPLDHPLGKLAQDLFDPEGCRDLHPLSLPVPY